MQKTNFRISLIGMMLVMFFMVAADNVKANLLINEVILDAPNPANEACNYVELKGAPNSVVPANFKFLSIDGDSGNFGFISAPVELGGLTVGSNGTITLINDVELCAGRTFPVGTTQVFYTSFINLGQGAETYAVVRSPNQFFEGDTIDANSDRVIDPVAQITVIDGFGVTVNALFQATYAPNIYDAVVLGGGSTDLPDAVTRFRNVNNPLNSGAFFYGEMASTPDDTTAYSGTPVSANFPVGGVLTPGDQNLPNIPTAASVTVGGRVKTSAGIGIYKARVSMTDSNGETITAITNPFGFYRFEEIPAGNNYIVIVRHKLYEFQPQIIQLVEERQDLDFTVQELPTRQTK